VLESNRPFVMLEGRVSAEVANSLRSLPYDGIQIDPLPRRFYPQEDLLCHTLGYVDFDGDGGGGLEGYYQRELAGEAASATINISPLTTQESVIAREGADLILTIDRSLQYTVEKHLQRALREHGAQSGTIIVMDPNTGAILALANEPCYSPFEFFEAEEPLLVNPAVTLQYEPGSVMKVLTMAAALDSSTVTPQTTYYDSGVLEVGGHRTVNWDRSAPGTTDMTTLLSRSLNVGAATLATAAAVAVSGVIGFVGLITPHAVRLAIGPEHRSLAALSALWGALFLVAADLLARTVLAPAEIPVGIVTALVGGPFFLYLLRRHAP
jgi:cell division protein FtsI/penicillin-binding protein 2